jgi:Ser/Thr protein kinase RdoA (MazF antagonist)
MKMNETTLENAAQRYAVSRSHLTPLSGGHVSHVYSFSKNEKDYVLRITPPNEEIDLQAMQAILAWMRFLALRGAAVSKPVLSQNNALIERVPQDEGNYIIVAFEKAPGILGEDLPFELWTSALCERLGQTVGRLHALAKTYVPSEAALKRPNWDEIGNCFHPLDQLPASEAIVAQKTREIVAQKMREIVARVQALSKDRESYGMIHTDLHGGNFFVDVATNTITVFDFDDCTYGWYAMDIAMGLFDALVLYPGADKVAFATRFMQDYLRGYTTENALAPFWLNQLPNFLKLLEIGIYTQVHAFYDPNDTDSWVGRFMAGRKHRIEHDVPYVDLDFVRLAEAHTIH